MRFVLLGAPGSGKGTQAGIISQKLGIAHVATGDLFREAVKKGNELGLAAKSYMDKGLLVPDDLTIRMLLERINSPDCGKGYILDGFPRTLEQAKALDEALAKRGEAVEGVLYVKVSTDELVRRLSGRLICRSCQTPYHQTASPPKVAGKCDRCDGELYQRADDSPETVRKRLEVFLASTAPLIDHYKKTGKLVEIDGEGEIQEVGRKAVKAFTSN